jgi:MFS family permease
MNAIEKRAAASLAAVFSVRLLGLFMVYPIFADYARRLHGATAATIGLALGIYGLSQGLLQIPFGLASDRLGRKRMVVLGLMLFVIVASLAGSRKQHRQERMLGNWDHNREPRGERLTHRS